MLEYKYEKTILDDDASQEEIYFEKLIKKENHCKI